MAHLIDKDAVVAKIESRISDIKISQRVGLIKKRDAEKKIALFKSILSLINTLEVVKEVDLDVIQRMKECPYRQVGCTMYEGTILECRGACSWVVDYLKLKEYKAQKGE